MRWLIPLLLVLAMFALPAQAQDASTLSLWAHGNEDGEEIIWMNADASDPRATDTANGPGYCPDELREDPSPTCPPALSGAPRVPGSFDYTFTMTMDPTMAQAAILQAGGEATFIIGLGATSGACEGTFTSTLSLDGQTVAQAADVAFSFSNGYEEFTAQAIIAEPDIRDGSGLQWDIRVQCDGTGLFLGVHSDTVKSHIELPLDAPVQEPTRTMSYFDIQEPANAALVFTEITDATYTYNWTNEFTNATIHYDIDVDRGTVELWLIDGADSNAFKQLFSEDASGNETGQWVTGPWQLRINMTGFQGNVTVQIFESGGEAPPSPTSSGTESSTSTTSSTSDTTTGNGTTGAGTQDSPFVAPALIVLGLVIMAARRRT